MRLQTLAALIFTRTPRHAVTHRVGDDDDNDDSDDSDDNDPLADSPLQPPHPQNLLRRDGQPGPLRLSSVWGE